MVDNITRIFKRTRKVLEKIAKKQGMPMHYNSIIMCINYMSQFTGEKVPQKYNDLDDEKIFDYFEKYVSEVLFFYPEEDRISKKIFAAYISSLDSTLVDTKETPVSFAERLFSLYDVDVE
jgi:hypothetical protein